jgi:polyhydroxyalkanoate synthase
VNHPAKTKYSYWTNPKLAATPEKWLEGAKETAGSWWPDWDQWLQAKNSEKVPARKIGNSEYKAIEDAPGRYVSGATPE